MKMKYCEGIHSIPAGENETYSKKILSVLQLADEKKTMLEFAEWSSQLSNRAPRENTALLKTSISLSLLKNQFIKSYVI